jgi:predicted SnoaL-like aldol condensation-catalyzing enzyme
MRETIASHNKALVLAAFDTLFNKRDYAAAERFWSPHYVQHSAHIAPGRDGLFNLINADFRSPKSINILGLLEKLTGTGRPPGDSATKE